jgi:hypothetical protein
MNDITRDALLVAAVIVLFYGGIWALNLFNL